MATKIHATIIYDYEIEELLSYLIEFTNIEKKNDITFTLVLNDTPNSFVVENNKIIFTSGLIKYISNPEALIGVIAHEIGHINNFHLTKRKKKIKDIQVVDSITNLATITSAIFSKNPEMILQSAILNKSNFQNYYSNFSKEQEKEADLFAVKRLNNLKISSKELVDFLKYLEKEFYKTGLSKDSFMFSTHPNYKDRQNIILSLSNPSHNSIEKNINKRFLFVKAKLFGHTENKIENLEAHLKDEFLDYGKAIILSKQGKLLESLKIINKLITNHEDNAFFLESKADILFNHGYTMQAKKFYELSLIKKSNNTHIKKRLFHINYDNLNLSNYDDVDAIFKKNNGLIFNYSSDINFYYKWIYVFQILNKEDWMLFVDAWIDILNQDINKAKSKLKEIEKISEDNILLKNTDDLIARVDNA